MNTSGLLSIDDINVNNKRVLLRVDFNVPIKDGQVTDDTRIRACLPTIQQLIDKHTTVLLMSHLGRPTEGKYEQKFSLAPVVTRLSEIMNKEIPLVSHWRQDVDSIPSCPIVMLENVRFEIGEKANDNDLAEHLASLCDVYVNDAFATAHRAQASTHGVVKYAALACAGPLIIREINALTSALADPKKPMIAIVGGAKVSTKLTVLESLLEIVDQLIVGGGIANTFLAATGFEMGKSLYEPDLVPLARKLMATAKDQGKLIPLPTDVVCGKEFTDETKAVTKPAREIDDNDIIMDVGPDTANAYARIIEQAQTIVWNGPLGVFEFEQFSHGTRVLSEAIAKSKAFSIAGGGDTLAAISKYGVSEQLSYISTAGGAFLEFLEGKDLPAITILKQNNN